MGRGVKILTELKDEKIVLLKDVDVQFVSLVRHGANQSPFRVIKSDGGGNMPKVIQAIILPNGVTLSSLTEKEELAWLSDAKQDSVQKFDEYQKLEQIPEDQFEDGSLQLVKLHPNGSFVMVGEMRDKEAMKSALTLGEQKEKSLDIPTNPMNEPIAERDGPSFVLTFRDMFEKELSSFLDVVKGAMSQSQSDSKKRKASVMNALESFKSFLAVGLDELAKSGSKKAKKEEEPAIEQFVERILAAINQKQEGNEMFKSEEEFNAAVARVVEEKLKAAESLAKGADGENAKGKNSLGTGGYTIKNQETGEEFKVKIGDDGQITEVKAVDPADPNVNPDVDDGKGGDDENDAEKDTVKKMELFSNRIEALENQLASDPAARELDDETEGKGGGKKSPFTGMFTTGHSEGGLNRLM